LLGDRHQANSTYSTFTYVALSRSHRRSVRLLGDFDDQILASHDTNLMQEDDGLGQLDDITKRWWQNMN
jgi:hypothetical protein